MYRALGLLLAVLLLALPAGGWEGRWQCLRGGGPCSLTTNPVFTGTVTADGFYSPPGTTGGTYTFDECEVTAGCPTAGQGHSLSVGLPDASDPLSVDTWKLAGRRVNWAAELADMTAYLTGAYCIPAGDGWGSPFPRLCASTTYLHATGSPFTTSIFFGTCTVHIGFNGWDANDKLVLRPQVYAYDTGTVIDVGTIANAFTVLWDDADQTDCVGTPNCAEEMGVFSWPINLRVDEGQGLALVQVDDTSVNPSGTMVNRFNVQCDML